MKTRNATIKISFLLLLFVTGIQGQVEFPNGTMAKTSYIEEIRNNISDEINTDFDTTFVSLLANLSLDFFIIKNNKGETDFNASNLDGYIAIVNEYFSPIGIQFNKGDVVEVNEYEYSLVDKYYPPAELLTKYASKNRINVFVVDSIKIDSIDYYGFTHFPTDIDSNYIYLTKSGVNGINLSTQLGHFMGLLSTHEVLGGLERINKSNCYDAGDFICDTYADPGLYGQVSINCLYTGTHIGPLGEYYAPSVANLMSDAPKYCRCAFTMEQYRRMYFYFKKFRQNLQ